MAIHGRHTMTMSSFALAIGNSPASIRRHFPDLDSLLAHILHRHLRMIARALGEAGRTHPGNQPALREAYAEATRTGLGALTEPHLLLTRDRHLLPADELEILERNRTAIGQNIAGELGQKAMLLLDDPGFSPALVEQILATIHEAETTPPASQEPQDTAGWAAFSPPGPTTQPPGLPLPAQDQISCRWPKARAGPDLENAA